MLAQRHQILLIDLATHLRDQVARVLGTGVAGESAQGLIVRYHDKTFSLTDALSFVVMERLDISHAFSFDHNFRQYGFQLLIGR